MKNRTKRCAGDDRRNGSLPVLTLKKLIKRHTVTYLTLFEGITNHHGNYSNRNSDELDLAMGDETARWAIRVRQSYIDAPHSVQVEVIRMREERDHTKEERLKQILGY